MPRLRSHPLNGIGQTKRTTSAPWRRGTQEVSGAKDTLVARFFGSSRRPRLARPSDLYGGGVEGIKRSRPPFTSAVEGHCQYMVSMRPCAARNRFCGEREGASAHRQRACATASSKVGMVQSHTSRVTSSAPLPRSAATLPVVVLSRVIVGRGASDVMKREGKLRKLGYRFRGVNSWTSLKGRSY
jgi:hypothetical protein